MNQKKHTVRTIQQMRDNGKTITMLTAYDYPTAKQINNFNGLMKETFAQYAEEVRTGVFPGEEHSYKMSDEVLEAIEKEFGAASA